MKIGELFLVESLAGEARTALVRALVLVELAVDAICSDLYVSCAAFEQLPSTGAVDLGSILEGWAGLSLGTLRWRASARSGLVVTHLPSLPWSLYS